MPANPLQGEVRGRHRNPGCRTQHYHFGEWFVYLSFSGNINGTFIHLDGELTPNHKNYVTIPHFKEIEHNLMIILLKGQIQQNVICNIDGKNLSKISPLGWPVSSVG